MRIMAASAASPASAASAVVATSSDYWAAYQAIGAKLKK